MELTDRDFYQSFSHSICFCYRVQETISTSQYLLSRKYYYAIWLARHQSKPNNIRTLIEAKEADVVSKSSKIDYIPLPLHLLGRRSRAVHSLIK